MTKKEITELLAAISNAVSAIGPYAEKRDAILAEASEDDKMNLEEFASWFTD